MRFARGQQRIGLHVPGSNRDASGPTGLLQRLAAGRPYLKIVLEDDRLSIEQEHEVRVGLDPLEHPIDGIDQTGPESLEGAIPLPIPVRVRDPKTLQARPPVRGHRPAASLPEAA